jgi:hypothetical protein
MPEWIVQGKTKILELIRGINRNSDDYWVRGRRGRLVPEEGPICNTVGCIAGTARVVAGKALRGNISHRAIRLLSGTPVEHDPLCDGDMTNPTLLQSRLLELFCNTEVEARYGSKLYARTVANHVKVFQHENKDALIAVKLK